MIGTYCHDGHRRTHPLCKGACVCILEENRDALQMRISVIETQSAFAPLGIALIASRARSAVEDVRSALAARYTVRLAASLAEVIETLAGDPPCTLLVIEVDRCEHAVDVAYAGRVAQSAPVVFAIHERRLQPSEAFALGRAGVRRLFERPFAARELSRELAVANEERTRERGRALRKP